MSSNVRGDGSRRAIVFVIDIEPDGRTKIDAANGWKGSSDALPRFARLRDELAEATGQPVRFSWFLRADPQIRDTWGSADFVAEACPRVITTIIENDDCSGMHVHMWRWSEERRLWFNDLTSAGWIEECIGTASEALTGIFGGKPDANRFGDRWMSEDAIRALRSNGVRYDLTMEPGIPDMPIHDDPHSTSWLPDFRGAPHHPYVPLLDNYMIEGTPRGDDLWMIPLSTTPIMWRLVRRSPFVMRGSRSPNLVLSHSSVWPNIRAQLDKPSDVPLSIVVRSGDFSNPAFLRNFLRTTRELVRHPALAYCEITTPDEAVARWKLALS